MSIVAVAAQLTHLGHAVDLLDLNIDELDEQAVKAAEMIGVSIFGAAYIPGTVELIARLQQMNPLAKVIVGGQTAERLTTEQFGHIFGQTTIQGNQNGLAEAIGCTANEIPKAETVSFIPVWKRMGEGKLVPYLEHEGTLVVSDGCRYNCGFCAASKNRPEYFRNLVEFEADLRYLIEVAKRHGLKELRFYASSLDFFQNPTTVRRYLEILALVQTENGVAVRTRCLSSMTSFLQASRTIPNFGSLLSQAGLWCVALGVDGSDKAVWQAQNKKQNSLSVLTKCLDLGKQIGLTVEILMVFGFPEDTFRTIWKTVWLSLTAVLKYNVIVRPYLAKSAVPGNEGWKTQNETVKAITSDYRRFYDLDFCVIGSSLTDRNQWHRWISNVAYVLICLLSLIGKSTTWPLLPQGENGLYGKIATVFNRLMPFDR
jgi:hypothetical protein